LVANDLSNPQPTIEDNVNIPQFSDSNIWKMYFDGPFSKDGVGVGILLISLDRKNATLSFKIIFEVTNNVAKYEALILGLELAKSLKVQNLAGYGDSELIVKHIRNIYQNKHPRLKAYRNEV